MRKNLLIIILICIFIGLGFAGTQVLKSILGFEQTSVYVESFTSQLDVSDGKSFGTESAFTFELYRGGTFIVDSAKGVITQQSAHYGDVALIRSTYSLPDTYRIRIEVGSIDYGLEHLLELENDPNYLEGPLNENGCYLIAITDALPDQHYTNDWWHQHRKLVIDVDNNVWGRGMPNPIFMVYFDRNNELMSYDGMKKSWVSSWEKGVEYKYEQFNIIELEKTQQKYIYRIFDERKNLLQESEIALDEVWHTDTDYPEYFVIGDPHENYYQGSFKLKQVAISM